MIDEEPERDKFKHTKEKAAVSIILVFLISVIAIVLYAIFLFEPKKLTPEEQPCTQCEKQCKEKYKDIGGDDPGSMWLHCYLSCNRKYGEMQCLKEKKAE